VRWITILILTSFIATGGGALRAHAASTSRSVRRILDKVVEAAGGEKRWRSVRDVSFVSSTAFFHPLAGEVRESVGIYEILLHEENRIRLGSLDPDARAVVAFAGEEIWLDPTVADRSGHNPT
jgi:hypothetical protein